MYGVWIPKNLDMFLDKYIQNFDVLLKLDEFFNTIKICLKQQKTICFKIISLTNLFAWDILMGLGYKRA